MDAKAPDIAQPRTPIPRSPLVPWNIVAQCQAVYYIVTGVWPLVHIKSFLKVTGPKTDLWLVKTVGVLVTVIGVVLGMGGAQRSARKEMAVLAVSSAAALTAIDVYYVARRRIAPIYLLDAAGEIGLIIGWLASGRTQHSAEEQTPR